MKYKVGDKVKIKTWEGMKKELGLTDKNKINTFLPFFSDMEEDLEALNTNRVVTIKKISSLKLEAGKTTFSWQAKTEYHFKVWHLSSEIIKYSVEEYKEPVPILNRFEILDL